MATKATKTTAASAKTAAPATNTQAVATVDWNAYSGEGTSGFENVQASDLGIPLLTIIQSKSAEVDKTHKDYAIKKIEGAEAGDIVNNVARRVIAKVDKGFITVIPAFYEKIYIEWKPNRGGMVKMHRNPGILDDVTGVTEKNEQVLRNGNLLIETAVFYVLLVNEDGTQTPAMINMISTQLKKARLWLNLALGIRLGPNKVNPPFFSHHYHLSTTIERKENNAWYGWKIDIGDTVSNADTVKQAIDIGTRARVSSAPKTAALPAPAHDDEPPM